MDIGPPDDPLLGELGPIVAAGADGQWGVDLGVFAFDLKLGTQG